MPTFPSPWAFRPFASAREGSGGGAHTTGEWYRSAGRDLGLKRILLTAALLLMDSASDVPE